MSQAQSDRSNARDASGRFVKNPCECCGKPAPMTAYHTWSHCDGGGRHGIGLVLRPSCAAKLERMGEQAALAVLQAREAVVAATPVPPPPVRKPTRWEKIAAKRAAAKVAQ